MRECAAQDTTAFLISRRGWKAGPLGLKQTVPAEPGATPSGPPPADQPGPLPRVFQLSPYLFPLRFAAVVFITDITSSSHTVNRALRCKEEVWEGRFVSPAHLQRVTLWASHPHPGSLCLGNSCNRGSAQEPSFSPDSAPSPLDAELCPERTACALSLGRGKVRS